MRQSNAVRASVVGTLFSLALVSCEATKSARNDLRGGVSTEPSVAATSAIVDAGSAHAVPAHQPSPVSRAVLPPEGSPTAGLATPLASACYAAFVPRATPRIDVTRLGMACGPVMGLAFFSRAFGAVDETGEPFVYRWDAHRRDCYRLFAVASDPVADLEVELVEFHGARLSLTNQNRRWVVIGDDAPFCATHDGLFEARFTTHGGHGDLAVTVWRGERMLKSKSGSNG